MLVAELVDGLRDERRLVVLVVGDVADDLVAVARVGPQALVLAARVLGDDGVRGREDRLRRPVVLLQQHDRRVGVVALEVLDVADVGAAEGVDRLVGVADHAQLGGSDRPRRGDPAAAPARCSDQLAHEDVLRVVGVLVLVDEHVAEAPPVVLGDVGERLEQVDGRHDQVVEVEGVRLLEARLVQRVDLGELLLDDRLGLVPEALVVDELVLQVADLVAHRPRREALGVEVQVAAHQRHEALAVGRVVDREGAGEPELLGLGAQDAHARRVEGHDPHGPGTAADDRGDALAHLGRGLVGERDGEDLAGLHPARREQVGDAGGERLGLARAGARDDEQRPALVHHGSALLGVQPLEEPLDVGALRRPRRGEDGRPGVAVQVVITEQAHSHQSRSGDRRPYARGSRCGRSRWRTREGAGRA